MYGDESSIFNTENIDQLEQLVMQQKNVAEAEEKEKGLKKRFGISDGDFPPVTL